MINKIYAFFKKNRKEIIIFLSLIVIFSIRFPYYVDSPGGILSLKKRFEIENGNAINGDVSLVYVAERPATIPSLLMSLILKDWDIVKREEVELPNETSADAEVRGRINFEQSLNVATVYAFLKAGKDIEILAKKIYVIYITEDAKTDIKIGDQIISVDGIKVESVKEIAEILEKHQIGDKVNIQVLEDDKEKTKTAEIISSNGNKKIGIATEIMYDYKTPQKVEYAKSSSEFGSSGGFANTLYIYSSLIDEDIIKGRNIVGTGTIDENGIVGAIGGVKYKLKAAVKAKADVFFIANSNCEEASAIKKEKKYNMEIVCIENFDEAISYLKGEN